MASVDLTTNAGQAAVAYQDALNQARNAQNALLRQYGFTAPAVGGGYTIEAAQRAFDPNVLFDKATGGIDTARLQGLAGSLEAGPTGMLADIGRGGAAAEAEAALGARSAGIAGGGLAAQRRRLAEAQTGAQLGQARSSFLAGLGEAMAPIGGAFQQLQIAQAQDKAAEEAARAAAATLPQQVQPEPENMAEFFAPEAAETSVAAGKPARAGTKMYELKGGFRWMGAKKGWQPVSGATAGKPGVRPTPRAAKPAPRPAPRPAPVPARPAPAPARPAPKPAPKKKK